LSTLDIRILTLYINEQSLRIWYSFLLTSHLSKEPIEAQDTLQYSAKLRIYDVPTQSQPGAQITTALSMYFHVHPHKFSVFPMCNLWPGRVMRRKAGTKLMNLNQNFPCCVRSGSRGAVGGTVASYCLDSLGIAVQFPVEAGDISPLQSVQTRSAVHVTSCSLGIANFPQRYDIQDIKLTIHCSECAKLYLCSAISFTVCRETTLSLLFRLCFCVSE
jgi:hypothetical protein